MKENPLGFMVIVTYVIKRSHRAVDCLNSGKYQHLRPVKVVKPTEQNLGKNIPGVTRITLRMSVTSMIK